MAVMLPWPSRKMTGASRPHHWCNALLSFRERDGRCRWGSVLRRCSRLALGDPQLPVWQAGFTPCCLNRVSSGCHSVLSLQHASAHEISLAHGVVRVACRCRAAEAWSAPSCRAPPGPPCSSTVCRVLGRGGSALTSPACMQGADRTRVGPGGAGSAPAGRGREGLSEARKQV